MQRIMFVHFQENLAWHVDQNWHVITVRVEDKRSVMLWLETNTTGGVVIHGRAKEPSKTMLNWHKVLTGNFQDYDFWFEDDRDAMTFKLVWS